MKKTLCLSAIIFATFPSFAQHNLGVSLGNWSGMAGLSVNPASVAGSNNNVVVQLTSLNAGVDNNLGYVNNASGIMGAIKDGKTKNLFAYSNSNTISLQAPYAAVQGPGVMVNINHRHTIALSTAIRGFNQFNNFDKNLHHTINDPNYRVDGNIDLTSKNFNYTAHLWSEVGLTYAAVVVDKGGHTLKAGGTLRYLGGIGYIGLKGNNLDAHYRAGADSFYVDNSDLSYSSNVVSTQSALLNGFSNNNVVNRFFGDKSGSGIGGDIGLVYEFTPGWGGASADGPRPLRPQRRPVRAPHNYLFRVAAAITDIGAINYDGQNNFTANVKGDGYITGKGLQDNVKNFDDFRSYAVRQGFAADTSLKSTKLYMPTALKLNVDYNIGGDFYVNALYVANLADRQNFGNSYYNQLSITPRYETNMFCGSIPLTYSALSGTFKAGLGLRFSGFYIGSDDMLGLIASGQYGANLYIGGFVPIAYKRNPDRDGDGINNAKDRCPNDYGPAENNGCPVKEEGLEPDVISDTTAAIRWNNNAKYIAWQSAIETTPMRGSEGTATLNRDLNRNARISINKL
jgi:hypothetical protein